ncbi:rod shape-determining protein RodA [Candidatus Uhrbacteria bacterium]|nr:rod shape-determining protein RodA [Candidatus Uhrbacteria bacterium]
MSALSRLRHVDVPFMVALVGLIAIGLVAIYSVALSKGGDLFQLQKQAIAVLISLAVFLAISCWNVRLLRNYSAMLYGIGNLLLLLVYFFGTTIRGTRGWFVLGPVSFQPVEFVKIALCAILALYFSRRARKRLGWREILESGALAAVPSLLVLFQPDFGSASVLFVIWFSFICFAGIRRTHFAAFIGAGGVLSAVGWLFVLRPYQKGRILSFLNPAADPLGEGYHSRQAMIAVGAGGLFGRGVGFGSQSQLKFLPEAQTDFIFAVIAEELGLIGSLLVLGGFSLLLYRLLLFSFSARDPFIGFFVLGVATTVFIEAFINIGMNLGMLPVTGLPLPLVSYGGSSLLFTMILLALAHRFIMLEKEGFS